ncbi:helix-turn-helix transcriptional regulator [Oricola nitratireducens]|uniref:helix-turn-helix transcriptional regulator n=1 Tax=Oricola nitratireducens TaxID=2775868 RepID=UPI001867DF88|nr:helix-turn-helix domain-containing protein [Oricola nitratireducens]
MNKLLTQTQVAALLGVSVRTVARMAKNGQLPKPVLLGNKPRFCAKAVDDLIHADGGDELCDGVTLTTSSGSQFFPIVDARFLVENEGSKFAVFELDDGKFHLRPWLTYVVDDLLDCAPVLLSCEDRDVREIEISDLPELASAAWELPGRRHM